VLIGGRIMSIDQCVRFMLYLRGDEELGNKLKDVLREFENVDMTDVFVTYRFWCFYVYSYINMQIRSFPVRRNVI